MVAKTSDSCRECFDQLRRLHKLRDRVDAASGYCTSNLEVLNSIQSIRGRSGEIPQTLTTKDTDLQGYVGNAKLLRGKIDNTIDLVSPLEVPQALIEMLLLIVSQTSRTLTLHNHQQTGKLDNEMKALTEETSKVTRKLAVITENFANDGEIVRVVTIVSAIYLPGSFATVSIRTTCVYNLQVPTTSNSSFPKRCSS